MSLLSNGLYLPAWLRGGFNRGGSAGPRRLVVIACVGAAMVALVAAVSAINTKSPVESKVAMMPRINPLPGGTHGDPAQDALLLRHGEAEARKAEETGVSYTPAMPASVPLVQKPFAELAEAPPAPAAKTAPVPEVVTLAPRPPVYVPPEAPHAERVNATVTNVAVAGDDEAYRKMIDHLFDGYGGHPPRTDIVLPAEQVEGEFSQGGPPVRSGPGSQAVDHDRPAAQAAPAGGRASKGELLIPAGRMIYAHTVLAVDSDTGGPIVLEADTGPLAGDRMLGVFTKNGGERLVVRVTAVEHRGQSVDVRGLVVAPDTAETSVASAVDEHYLERFALPAAAAFIEGVGQAMAMSGAVTQVTPFGGSVTQFGNLNLKQQLGVGAGAAAQQVGTALQQDTPKGPTVKLESNVSVEVMFLADVVLPK